MELEAIQRATERLAETAAELEGTLPARLAEAFRAEAVPVGRQLAEVRGLTGQVVRSLERVEGDLAAERHARVDDLALLVDLVASGWKSVDTRLRRIEHAVGTTHVRAA